MGSSALHRVQSVDGSSATIGTTSVPGLPESPSFFLLRHMAGGSTIPGTRAQFCLKRPGRQMGQTRDHSGGLSLAVSAGWVSLRGNTGCHPFPVGKQCPLIQTCERTCQNIVWPTICPLSPAAPAILATLCLHDSCTLASGPLHQVLLGPGVSFQIGPATPLWVSTEMSHSC